jgi:hypothetical protein
VVRALAGVTGYAIILGLLALCPSTPDLPASLPLNWLA